MCLCLSHKCGNDKRIQMMLMLMMIRMAIAQIGSKSQRDNTHRHFPKPNLLILLLLLLLLSSRVISKQMISFDVDYYFSLSFQLVFNPCSTAFTRIHVVAKARLSRAASAPVPPSSGLHAQGAEIAPRSSLLRPPSLSLRTKGGEKERRKKSPS